MAEPDDITQPATESPSAPVGPLHFWRGLTWGLLTGWILVFLPYAVALFLRYKGTHDTSWMPTWSYNGSLLLLLPLAQGFVGGLMRGTGRQSISSGIALVSLMWMANTILAGIIMHEGIICVLMAAPLLWALHGIGYMFGRLATKLKRARTLSMSFAPLILLATVGETVGPLPNHASVITDSVTVNAPASYVWTYVVDYPDNPNPPDYWMWRIGLPAPTHSVAPVQKVGARRDCKFTGDQAFEERITELEPNKKLTFAITKQPQHPEIIDHIDVDQGQIVLHDNGDGTTTVTATSWYRLHVRPAGYFDWWAADVTRHIHFRVLGYMKTLAERDYRAANGK